MTPQIKAHWSSIFDLAESIQKLIAAQTIEPARVAAGFRLHGAKEPFILQMFESVDGLPPALRYIAGWKALAKTAACRFAPEPPVRSWALEIPMFELLFVHRSQLMPPETALLHELGGDGAPTDIVPTLRTIVPGTLPWIPEEPDLVTARKLLNQTLGLLLRLEEDPDFLTRDLPGALQVFSEGADGKWNAVATPFSLPAPEPLRLDYSDAFRTAFEALPMSDKTFWLDLRLLPVPLPLTPTRPPAFYALVAIEPTERKIMAAPPIPGQPTPQATWQPVLDALLKLFSTNGGCPATIETDSPRMMSVLRELELLRPFKLLRRERIPLLDKAVELIAKNTKIKVERKKPCPPKKPNEE